MTFCTQMGGEVTRHPRGRSERHDPPRRPYHPIRSPPSPPEAPRRRPPRGTSSDPSAFGWFVPVPSGASTPCRSLFSVPIAFPGAHGDGSWSMTGSCDFPPRPSLRSTSSWKLTRPKPFPPTSSTKCDRLARSVSRSTFSPWTSMIEPDRHRELRRSNGYRPCRTKVAIRQAGPGCLVPNAELFSTVGPIKSAGGPTPVKLRQALGTYGTMARALVTPWPGARVPGGAGVVGGRQCPTRHRPGPVRRPARRWPSGRRRT